MMMFGWMWQADAERLAQFIERLNAMPLGASRDIHWRTPY